MNLDPSKPYVSILTSYYRGEKYLSDFLKNFESQDIFPNLELVIDLNEPSNLELEIINEFAYKFPGVLNFSINEFVVPMSVSLNNCILRSKADFLCIWNVDDRRTVNSISSQFELIRTTTDINVVYGPFVITGNYKSVSGKLVDNSGVPKTEFTRAMLLGPFFMFRKSMVSKISYFDEQLSSAADFDFAVRLAFFGGLASTQDVLGYFLDDKSGLSTKFDSVGPVERSVIQLRYGVIGLFNVIHIPYISNYVIPFIKFRSEWIPIDSIVKDYEAVKAREISRTPRSNNSIFRQALAILRNQLFS